MRAAFYVVINDCDDLVAAENLWCINGQAQMHLSVLKSNIAMTESFFPSVSSLIAGVWRYWFCCEKRKVLAGIDEQIQLGRSSSVTADLTSDQSSFGRCLLWKSALSYSGLQSERALAFPKVCFICHINVSVESWIMKDAWRQNTCLELSAGSENNFIHLLSCVSLRFPLSLRCSENSLFMS